MKDSPHQRSIAIAAAAPGEMRSNVCREMRLVELCTVGVILPRYRISGRKS